MEKRQEESIMAQLDQQELIRIINNPLTPEEMRIALSFPDSPASRKLMNEEIDRANMKYFMEMQWFYRLLDQLLIKKRDEEVSRTVSETKAAIREKALRDEQFAKETAASRQQTELEKRSVDLDKEFNKINQAWQQVQQAQAKEFVTDLIARNVQFVGPNNEPIQLTSELQKRLENANANTNLPTVVAIVMNANQELSNQHQKNQNLNARPIPITPDTAAAMNSLNKEFNCMMAIADQTPDTFDFSAFLKVNKLNKGKANFAHHQKKEEEMLEGVFKIWKEIIEVDDALYKTAKPLERSAETEHHPKSPFAIKPPRPY